MIKLTNNLKSILSIIEEKGYKAYIVGGYVRDQLLGIESIDYDIATTLPLEKLENILPNSKTVDSSGTNFLNKKIFYNNEIFEITNLRIEGPYKKLGYPSKIKKTTDIYEDLKRRDFTINAIAYSMSEGLIDPYLGQKDIQLKIIRTIKNPYQSYSEDPTRILRAFRFSFKYGFEIEKENMLAIKRNKHLLKQISAHQLQKELSKFTKEQLKKIEDFL